MTARGCVIPSLRSRASSERDEYVVLSRTNRTHPGVLAMLHFARRSLLVQLLSVYLVFVIVVLIGGVVVNAVVEQQLSTDVQASDEALAQEIALETSLHLRDAENALIMLGKLAAKADSPGTLVNTFQAWKSARSDVD